MHKYNPIYLYNMYICPYTKICYYILGGVKMGNKYTEAQAAATKKYLKNIGEYKLRVSKEDKEKYMAYAKTCGMSLNAFIIQAINEKIERDCK